MMGALEQAHPHRSPRARGRSTSSPLQLGQTSFIAFAQSAQKVHSKVQMYASSRGDSLAAHFSHSVFISNAIVRL